jgi:hypothetical protein
VLFLNSWIRAPKVLLTHIMVMVSPGTQTAMMIALMLDISDRDTITSVQMKKISAPRCSLMMPIHMKHTVIAHICSNPLCMMRAKEPTPLG